LEIGQILGKIIPVGTSTKAEIISK